MKHGTVKWFSVTKGYGFIIPDDGSKDVMFFATDAVIGGIPRLVSGLRVAFESTYESRGERVTVLRPLAFPEPEGWQLVPTTPTPEMLAAGELSEERAWQSVLSASPRFAATVTMKYGSSR